MAMYLVTFKLSNKGEVYEEAEAYLNVETLDLEELFHTVQEDMAIQYELEDFVNQNYGELEFDAWKPNQIFQYVLMEDGLVDGDKEPSLVWKEGDGEVRMN